MKYSSTSAECSDKSPVKQFRFTFIPEAKRTKVRWRFEGRSMAEALRDFIFLSEEMYPAGIRVGVCIEEIKAESIPEQPSHTEWRAGA